VRIVDPRLQTRLANSEFVAVNRNNTGCGGEFYRVGPDRRRDRV
jgi:hypothetical protein